MAALIMEMTTLLRIKLNSAVLSLRHPADFLLYSIFIKKSNTAREDWRKFINSSFLNNEFNRKV